MLQHNSYFDGQVQSVAFERQGQKQSVGVIEPGTHEFGTGAPLLASLSRFPDFIPLGLAVSPDGKTLIAGGSDGRIRVYRIRARTRPVPAIAR